MTLSKAAQRARQKSTKLNRESLRELQGKIQELPLFSQGTLLEEQEEVTSPE